MSRKSEFVGWLATNKLKSLTPGGLADLLENVFSERFGVDVWSVSDPSRYKDFRDKLLKDKSFKKADKKRFKLFVWNNKHFLVFLETHQVSETNTIVEKPSENKSNKSTISGTDIMSINRFFVGDIIANRFLQLFSYAKEKNDALVLDVRNSIIGVKAPEERLRFYSDKKGQLKFAIVTSEAFSLSASPFLCENLCQIIDDVELYFEKHPQEVNLAADSSSHPLGYIYHKTFGFGCVEAAEQDSILVVFKTSQLRKQLAKGHDSFFTISGEEYEKEELKKPFAQPEGPQRIPWNKYETALLIDGFWQIERHLARRSEVVSKLSSQLRRMATNSGRQINDYFRNENGINIQLSNVALSFFPERSAMHRTAIFDDIAHLYKTDRKAFDDLLNEAKRLADARPGDVRKAEAFAVSDNSAHSLSLEEADFFTYVKESYEAKHANDGKAPKATAHARMCISCIRDINNRFSTNLYTITKKSDLSEIAKKIDSLGALLDEQSVNWLRYALKKYGAYFQETFVKNNQSQSGTNEIRVMADDYLIVLREVFPDGFAFKNPLRKKRFISKYEEYNAKPFADNEDQFLKKLESVGFVSEGKLYLPTIVSEELKLEIESYLQEQSRNKKAGVYYSAVFDAFSEKLNSLFTVEMLGSYLRFVFQGKYDFHVDHLTLIGGMSDLRQEIIDIFTNVGTPLDINDLYNRLPGVAHEAVDEVIRDRDFVVNHKGHSYFYWKIVYIDEPDLSQVEAYLHKTIGEKDSVSGHELYSYLRKELPDLVEMNPGITDLGFKNLFKILFSEKFSFKGDLICTLGSEMDVGSLYRAFCRSHAKFTLDDIETYRNEINQKTIYWDEVYIESLRIDETHFVRRDLVPFDTKGIDKAIAAYVINGYASFTDIVNFTEFPTTGVSWNNYLLEGYLFLGSDKYMLLHATFNSENPTGGIVARDSGIESFDDLLVAVIRDNRLFERQQAFDYLIANDFIKRRKNKNMDALIERARRTV